MPGDLLQFVDSVSATPTVRLDLNDDVTWGLDYEGTDLSPPDLKEAWAGTLLADGELLTAAAFANRTLRLSLDLITSTVDGQGVQLQKLWRELNRPPMEPGGPNNLIRWQPNGASKPVFFLTFRSSRNRVTDMPGAGTYRRLAVEIEAKPDALGLKELAGTFTVYNDPNEATEINSNPYFETDASGWSALGGTVARSTAQAHEGVASLLLTPDGVTATVEARAAAVPVTAGVRYRASAWVRCVVARNIAVGIIWRDASNALISSATTTVGVAATTWTPIDTSGTAPAGAVTAQLVGASMSGTPLATHTVHIDEARLRPVDGSVPGGQCLDLTGIQGDVETPLRLSMPSGQFGGDGRASVLAVRRRGTPSKVPYVLQAEAMSTIGADTTVQANSSVMSGSGSNYTRTTFATTAMSPRLDMLTWPATGAVDLRGTYRVFARIRKTVADDVISLQLAWGGGLSKIVGDVVPTAQTTDIHLVDLGLMSIPVGPDPVTDGPTGMVLPVKGTRVELRAARATGTGALDIDYLVFVPADDRLALIRWGGWAGGGQVVADGVSDSVYGLTLVGEVADGVPSQVDGDHPLVYPGSQVNRIFFLRTVGVGTVGPGPFDDTLDTTQVTVEYWPRYLSVRPPSS